MLRRVLALIVISVLALPSVSADCATLLGQAGSTWIPVNPVMPSPGITFSSSAPKHVSYDGNVVLTSAGVDAAWDSDPCAGATEPPGASSFGQVAWGFEPSPSTGASITPLGNGVQITPPDVGSAQVWSCCASMPSKRDATFFNIGSCWPKGYALPHSAALTPCPASLCALPCPLALLVAAEIQCFLLFIAAQSTTGMASPAKSLLFLVIGTFRFVGLHFLPVSLTFSIVQCTAGTKFDLRQWCRYLDVLVWSACP